MPVTWEAYMSPQNAATRYMDCARRCRPAFAPLRGVIGRLASTTEPRTVACLGAGVLNDLPIKQLIRSGADIHLADWLPGIVDAGLSKSIIDVSSDKSPACVFCALDDATARKYCRNFCGPKPVNAGVCAGYKCDDADVATCNSYLRDAAPQVHMADVTGGFASSFANRTLNELKDVGSWRQALRRGLALARKAPIDCAPLDIPDQSIDLAISSMVVSQFVHEPYDYFTRQVEDRLGPPNARENQRLLPQADELRRALLDRSFEGHCREIERILAPDGRCFMTFELFHYDTGAQQWILVDEMHRLLSHIAERFRLDFDILSEQDYLVRYVPPATNSLVCCLVFTLGTTG